MLASLRRRGREKEQMEWREMGVPIRQGEDRIIYRTVIKRKKRGGVGKRASGKRGKDES